MIARSGTIADTLGVCVHSGTFVQVCYRPLVPVLEMPDHQSERHSRREQ